MTRPPKAQPPRKRSGKRTGEGAKRWKEASGLAEGASSQVICEWNLSGTKDSGGAILA